MKFEFRNYLTNPFKLIKLYNDFKKSPYKPKAELDAETLKKLKELCIYCSVHVPYYKKLFKEIGFVPEQIHDYNDFKKIPVLDKDIVRTHFDELQSDEIWHMNTVLCSTSGSTGTPLKIYLDSFVNQAIFCKLWHLWNQDKKWHIGKVLLTLDGDNTELANKKWYFNPKNRFLYFTPFHIKKENIHMYYNIVKKYKPATMKGYPSAIYMFGKLLEADNLHLSFDTIFVHSENLMEYQKRFFEDFFGARVAVQYGNNEKAGLIYSCVHNQLHSQDDYAYHEVLDSVGNDVKAGEEGRLVCTNLFNRSMPLLRYDTRDIVSFAEGICTCGSHFKVVKKIIGRASDVIYTDDGRIISLIDSAFWKCDNIVLASIHQPREGEILVRLVKGDHYTKEDEKILLQGLRERCGSSMNISIKYVCSEEIPRTPAGKIRFITSNINQNL